MINVEKAIKEFDKYAKSYDLTKTELERKYHHTYRVMKYSENIAKSLNLSDGEIEISKIIGLLHDIARFEQFTIYSTFSDSKSVDHGDLAVKILEQNNYIRNFIEEDKYDDIILKAIKNHNKYKIEENLNEKVLLQSKIIRDADKLDIFYETQTIFYQDKEKIKEIENSVIKEEKLSQIKQKKLIKKEANNKQIDMLLINLGFVFDINFKYSFKILKEKDYINKIIDKFEFKDKENKKTMQEIRNILNQYIEEKIKGE